MSKVAAGELLFVPSGGAASWRTRKGAVEDEAIALQFCYVDASNFDFVKTQLPLYAAVEVCLYYPDHKIHQQPWPCYRVGCCASVRDLCVIT